MHPQTPQFWEPDHNELSQERHFSEVSFLTHSVPKTVVGRFIVQSSVSSCKSLEYRAKDFCTVFKSVGSDSRQTRCPKHVVKQKKSFITLGIGWTHFCLKTKCPSCQVSETQLLSRHKMGSGGGKTLGRSQAYVILLIKRFKFQLAKWAVRLWHLGPSSGGGGRGGCISYAQLFSHGRLFVIPVHCSPPGSSVHGVFQAKILEQAAISSSRGSSQPRDRTHVSCISCTDRQIYHCTTWK